MGFQFQPIEALKLSGNVHDSISDSTRPGPSTITTGDGFSAEGKLPFNSVLTLGINSDSTGTDASAGSITTNTYDAQLQQPIGKIPLSAILKGHYTTTANDNSPLSQMPSLEQSLVWKPMQDTSIQMGLRQQHYQVFPGDKNDFNEALFADLSQKIVGDVTWHSYAEVLNSRTTDDAAPIVPIASGANGTPQTSTPPGKSALAMPTLDDSSLTFSTGPSFKLQKDISASVEYSNRWDKAPAPGTVGPEQRISVSVKGTF